MNWVYYIDGYNVIHHSAILQPLAREDFEAARDALIEKVSRFCAGTGAKTTIVFDGRGHAAESAPLPPGLPCLEVLYSPRGKTADMLIERRVYASTNRRNTIVVTADRGIRDLCMALGALVMSPDKFLATAREAYDATARALERIRRATTRELFEDRIGESGRERLRHIRRRLGP